MYILRIANISKKYKIGDNKEKSVLNNISLMFEETGLVSIVGKSGSGKSTIMNIISTLDQPTNGCVYYLNQNIQQWNKSRIEAYRTSDIGIVFQHYHLLEKETALFNVMLPALIAGKSYKEAEIAAKSLLKSINFKESLYTQKCSDLSGGEKERIAILRAIINNPKILLADEPTGALDTKNSKIVMDLLKEISKNRLVILVSHNSKLVKKYSDRIITLKDGHIENIKEKKTATSLTIPNKKEKKLKTNNRWMSSLAKSNFRYRIKRNIVAMASLVVGLISSMLIIGFSNGSNDSIRKRSYQKEIPDVISKLKRAFPDYDVVEPMSSINESVNQVCTYIEIALMCFSIIAVVISTMLLSICNYLYILENKKDIGLVRCIGVDKSEAKKFVVTHSMIMCFISFALSSVELFLSSFLISGELANQMGNAFSFSFNPLALVYMFALAFTISLLSSLFIARKVNKLDPLSALKS